MTAEESVKAIYPTATLFPFKFAGLSVWSVKVRKEKGMQSWDVTLAEDYTPERAWEQAWRTVQKQMLDKLAE